MVDSISGGTSVSVGAAVTPMPKPELAATAPKNTSKHARSTPEIKPLDDPQVRITEVADQAAAERKSSLNSLDQMADELREAITALNAALDKTRTRAIITRDEELNRFVVRIADEKSGEVVREIPSEAVLKFARNLQELKGLIFDKSL